VRAYTYLNYAGLAPIRPGSIPAGLLPVELFGNALLPPFFKLQEDARRRTARWLGTEPRHVAFLSSTTAALQAVAGSFDWRPGDVVLYPDGDFPSNVFPWQDLARFGVHACPVDDWDAPWPDRTRLVSISTVDFTSGAERPWRAVCQRARSAGIWTCLDAVQSAGIAPCHSFDVDFWAAGTQKWLVSGLGLGLLVLSDRAIRDLRAPWRSYLSLRRPPDAASGMRDDARQWENGWVTPGAVLRFRSTLGFFERYGWQRVEREVRARRDYLYSRLLALGVHLITPAKAASGIVSVDPRPLASNDVVRSGYRRRIVTAERGPFVRIAAHCFTPREDLDRAIDWLWDVLVRSGNCSS
jgi:cysteine desulfurase/selenocysteine lyase